MTASSPASSVLARLSPAAGLPAPPAIALRGVSAHYGAVCAVENVDLDVHPGELFGLIGHNGAGKSTLFKMMLGLLPPSAGQITVAGAPVRGAAFRAARRRIGYLPENLVLYDNLSGLETLRFLARLKGVPAQQCPPMLEQVGLGQAGDKPVRAYSKGMRQRLGFAQALLGDPRVLFLDEPTNGLDPAAIRDMYALLQRLKSRGATIVITSHVLAELQERVDRLAIMANGRIQALGSVQALRERQHLPLTLELHLRPAPSEAAQVAALADLLARLGTLPVQLLDGPGAGVLHLACRREDKLAVLAGLATLPLQDLLLREPSLEDLFFDLRSAA